MYENNYMYAVERNGEYLAHYGIRGMKWGVRKAIASGNSARLSKQYAKAQKKLAKLEKRAANSGKYAKRAALMGAGAAAAGGLAVAGTKGVGNAINYGGKVARKAVKAYGNVASGLGKGLANASYRLPIGTNAKLAVKQAGLGIQGSGNAAKRLAKGTDINVAVNKVGEGVKRWGNDNGLATGAARKLASYENKAFVKTAGLSGRDLKIAQNANRHISSVNQANLENRLKQARGISNNTIARIGAGAVGAGLAVGAARNAYKAATAQKKAAQFRSEMNKAFAGTKYGNGNRQGKKRRK